MKREKNQPLTKVQVGIYTCSCFRRPPCHKKCLAHAGGRLRFFAEVPEVELMHPPKVL